MTNIFVVGFEPFNLALMRSMPGAGDYTFINLLAYSEAVRPRSTHIDFLALIDLAERRLEAFRGPIDAIVGYWDFPSSVLVPLLQGRHDLAGPPLQAVAKCEHKYWSRLEQSRAIPEYVPRFCAIDPFAGDPLGQVDLAFPFWLKPIKSHSSYLGFKIRNEAEFNAAIPIIRAGIGHFGEPFDEFLDMVDCPPSVAGVTGNSCIAEDIISSGQQCTLEGYSWRDEVTIYGVVDSVRSGLHRSCFARYQYPSRLPKSVQNRMISAAQTLIRHLGYTNAPFNIEFYWESETDAIRLLEINARISKSHSPLFKMVDGAPHQKIAVELALGHRPAFPHRQGHHRVAAKFMRRVFQDARVVNVPSDADIARLTARFPDALTRILAHAGDRLAHLPFQDSYSFEIAELFLGAEDQPALLDKHREALKLLPFQFEPLKPGAA